MPKGRSSKSSKAPKSGAKAAGKTAANKSKKK